MPKRKHQVEHTLNGLKITTQSLIFNFEFYCRKHLNSSPTFFFHACTSFLYEVYA